MSRLALAVLVFLAVGMAGMLLYKGVLNNNSPISTSSEHGTAFFRSPKAAVSAIRVMLENADWVLLARYYDLSGSSVDRETLTSGAFFQRTERPEAAHPGEFWRYKHPFPPQFEFDSATSPDETGLVTVRVVIRIDQGANQPAQEGWQEFRMLKSAEGLQILPD